DRRSVCQVHRRTAGRRGRRRAGRRGRRIVGLRGRRRVGPRRDASVASSASAIRIATSTTSASGSCPVPLTPRRELFAGRGAVGLAGAGENAGADGLAARRRSTAVPLERRLSSVRVARSTTPLGRKACLI